MNVDKFKAVLKESGHTLGTLAEALGLTYQCIQYRNTNNAWKTREIKEVAAILGLNDRQVKEIWLQ